MQHRREFLQMVAFSAAGLTLAGCKEKNARMNELWHQWQADWRWMQQVAERRGWDLSPVAISAPASGAALRRLEAAAGMSIPEQLREVLSGCAASVRFGWNMPSHLTPMEQRNFPTSSFNRGFVWDLDQIANHAIPGFLAMKQGLAEVDESEAPNTPDMWERQFPVFWLINGDILTIDMRRPEGPHPVRYFSHELEVLHGQALAPDFLTFVSEMARLGQAGTEWASWMLFGEWDEDRYYLRADSPGGREWRRWLESDPAVVEPDEPPPVILGETAAERVLLEAAQRGDTPAAMAALAGGARPDVVWNPEWIRNRPSSASDDEFATAVTFAVRRNDTSLVERLLAHGASLDTRHLAIAEAVSRASVDTLRWLCRKGARVDGWKNERYWPIHLLMTQRQRLVAANPEELELQLREEYGLDSDEMDAETAALRREALEPLLQRDVKAFITQQDYLAMLETLLESGAAPDAPWDNGTTMLMWSGPESARILLRYGADPNYHAPNGMTPLHFTRSAAVARVLVEVGADVNALASPNGRKSETDPVYTPLQSSLMLADLRGTELAETLLDLGADPSKRDGEGYPTLGYATNVPAFELMRPYGLDSHERMPDGGTLLHRLYKQHSVIRANFPKEVEILDILLAEGLDINAQDNAGQTVLHIAAPNAIDAASIEILLERGADKSLRDANGKRALDLIPRSRQDLRGALTSAR
ncbi:ankyrin repeat domain-containing protein [Afifella marina]|nr:ankyrin repeat domain-containing protein [Afifella marina]